MNLYCSPRSFVYAAENAYLECTGRHGVITDRQVKVDSTLIQWNWPKRLQQNAIVYIDKHRLVSTLIDSGLSWNSSKTIVLPCVRGEGTACTESNKRVESQSAKINSTLSSITKLRLKRRENDWNIKTEQCAVEVKDLKSSDESLDSEAEQARSLQTRDIHAQFKIYITREGV